MDKMIQSGFDLSFWGAVVKIYPFTIWYSVNKSGKVKNIAQQVFPGHRTIYLQHIFQLLKTDLLSETTVSSAQPALIYSNSAILTVSIH